MRFAELEPYQDAWTDPFLATGDDADFAATDSSCKQRPHDFKIFSISQQSLSAKVQEAYAGTSFKDLLL